MQNTILDDFHGNCLNSANPHRREYGQQCRVLFASHGWPAGMHEVASYLVHQNLADVAIHQIESDNLGSAFDEFLLQFRPHIVGFRVEGGEFRSVCNNINKIREKIKTIVILGGPAATSHPVDLLRESGADCLFAGDAEESVAEFVKILFCSKSGLSVHFNTSNFSDFSNQSLLTDLSKIPGLFCNIHEGYIFVDTKIDFATKNIICPKIGATRTDRVYVSEKLLRKNRLNWSILHGFTKTLDSIYLTGGRGCPGRCTFCAKMHGPNVRTKTALQLIDEVRGAAQLIEKGGITVSKWPLYKHTNCPNRNTLLVSWCSIFDEDFFLDKKRAIEFLQLFEFYRFNNSFRLGFQTNPCSLLDKNGNPDSSLFYWISRLKAMIQVGAESFNQTFLTRWKKRHSISQLELVLSALDQTGQDYNIFHLSTDYHTKQIELLEGTRLLLEAMKRHPNMRVASSPFTIPLFDTETRVELEQNNSCTTSAPIRHFTDYEVPHPEWMLPNVVDLADKIDLILQNALHLEQRDSVIQSLEQFVSVQSILHLEQ
ncbi:MAG: cobalamin-dependent protein [Thermoguttaceae bacterium]